MERYICNRRIIMIRPIQRFRVIHVPQRKISARASAEAPTKPKLPNWLGERPVVLHGLEEGPTSLRATLLTYCGKNPAAFNPHLGLTPVDAMRNPKAVGLIELALGRTDQETDDFISAVILCVRQSRGSVS